MKAKLLLTFTCLLMAGMLNGQTQQMWAVTALGGTSNGGTIISMNPDGSGFSVEFNYTCSMTSGCRPMGNLLQASNGQLYGTCFLGGQYGSCTIDRYDPVTGTYYDVYDFDIVNGDFPRSGLIEAPNGKLYGVASAGGSGGVLYSLNLSSNAYVPEHMFSSSTGYIPWGCPILKNGKLYGLTTSGGSGSLGVLYSYEISSDTYTPLHHFSGVDGATPKGSLFEASNGLFYGLASGGGASGHGTIFSYDPVNNSFALLHSFNNTEVAAGRTPEGTLMQAADGKLYGVTKMGGVNDSGVLFSYDPVQNAFVKLRDFTDDSGSEPMGNLFQSPNGLLYGTASAGGPLNKGALFSYDITLNAYTVILDFNGTNGANPGGGFIMVDVPVGTPELQNKMFSAYPNPASEEINITFAKEAYHTLELRNVTGEVLSSAESYSAQAKIDVSRLPKGIYFVEVKEENGKILNKKIVKM